MTLDILGRRVPEPRWMAGPDWDEQPLFPTHRCTCGAWLPERPGRTEPWEDAIDCDGSETLHEQEYDAGTVAILGPGSYMLSVSSCGIDRGRHASHREVLASGIVEYRTCKRCGVESKETW